MQKKASKCRECEKRICGVTVSEADLQALCWECRQIQRLDSSDMPVFPVYSLEGLGISAADGRPVLGRSGLIQL